MTAQRNTILGLFAAVVAVPVALVFALIINWPIGVLIGLISGGAVAWMLWRGAASMPERAYGAREDRSDRMVMLENIADGICLANGLDEPRLALIDSSARNAALVGRSEGEMVLVTTTGLLDAADLLGVEAFVAHLLARPHDPVRTRTLLASLPAIIPSGLIERLAPPPPGRIEADRSGLALTRYPPGLAATLEVMCEGSTVVDGVGPIDDALWLAPATTRRSEDRDSGERIEDRIEVLREL